ncbi:unnamed protein product [Rotaria magnacalcarata]|uniref:Translocator protein n=2 Tax=Rotaria magnacalcarata TaxID=392030 RepID=A0A817A8W8_9BILA|nr:unnamed protein product [Rotaria magnacalcarata]
MDMNWISFFGWILLPQIGGVLGGLVTAKQIKTWYKKLLKPAWRLPNAIFGPVWTIFHLLMGIASYLVARDGQGSFRTLALTFYFIQLFLNWSWTPILFCFSLIRSFPYLIWVGFASALTMSIWQLNSPYAQPSSRRQRSVSDPHQQ